MRRFLVAFNYLGKGEDDDLSFLTTLVNATSLELLELNTNNFGGVLPASISNLSTELIELSLSYNQISGEIPRGISNLKKLQAFFVAYNRFHGAIPSEISDLIYLQELVTWKSVLWPNSNLIGKFSFFNQTQFKRKQSPGENSFQFRQMPQFGTVGSWFK
ncbi:hypothetical protein KY285_016600 [Solanum tuberosum]|nr:hypothetical protein KY284_016610 [Solanum tuberosum]KAH0702322.1 hypothetical protein KY285_016600 [Solanum tuberosum]